jgi:lysozyme
MKEILNEWKKFVNEADKKAVSKKKVEPTKPKTPGIYSNTYTENAVNLIKRFEKFKSMPYQKTGDKPTIGFGTTEYVSADGKTRKPVTMKDNIEIPEDLADEYMRNYLNFVVMPSLNNYLKIKNLTSNQIDALVSIMYNKGNTAFLNSPIFTAVNKNPDDRNLKNIFLADAAGKDAGILARRQAEWELYSV